MRYTVLGSLIPGLGLIKAGRRRLGSVILGVFICLIVFVALTAILNRHLVLQLALNPAFMLIAGILVLALGLAWVGVIVVTNLSLSRGRRADPRTRLVNGAVVAALAFVVAAPTAVASVYTFSSASLVSTVFANQNDSHSATRPTLIPSAEDQWAGKPRVNILLLGGDSNAGQREGVRTDTVMVASIDTRTGNATLFGLPRNTAHMPFPKDSPLYEHFPNGFTAPDGNGDNLEYMLNAMYLNAPNMVPKDILGPTDNLAADILKVSVGEALGLKIDYYVLLDIQGLVQMINALGGVTVNINPPRVPVGGVTGGRPPDRYLEPGPNQHLNGVDAMWFARGRYGLDDYHRMERQRCVINAVIAQANPVNMLARYEAIAQASKGLVLTDIPQQVLPMMVELSLRVKNGNLRSVIFEPSTGFHSGNPDFDQVRDRVKKAIGEAGQPAAKPTTPTTTPTVATRAPTSTTSSSSPTSSPSTSSSPTSGSTSASEDLRQSCEWHG